MEDFNPGSFGFTSHTFGKEYEGVLSYGWNEVLERAKTGKSCFVEG